MKKTVFLIALLVSGTAGRAQNVLLQEDFKQNTANVSGLTNKTLGSGVWQFYYTDRNYNSITECAVLKYSGSSMGYIITPALNKPAELIFDVRTVGNVSNRLEIQTSVNGGAFTTVASLLVSGTNPQQHTIMLNETNDNIRIKFLRTKPASDGTNYNLIIDNVKVLDKLPEPEPESLLQVANGNKAMQHNSSLCLTCYDSSYIDLPFTLSNSGEATLTVSGIDISGGSVVGNNAPFDILTGNSADIMLRINCADTYAGNRFMTIHSNYSGGAFTIAFDITR